MDEGSKEKATSKAVRRKRRAKRAADEDVVLTVTWGEEKIQVERFHSVTVGGLTATTTVPRSRMKQAARELHAELAALADELADARVDAHIERLEELQERLDARREG